jgi:competence protein ComEA
MIQKRRRRAQISLLYPLAMAALALILLSTFPVPPSVHAGQAAAASQAAAAKADSPIHDQPHPEFPSGEGRDAVMRLCVRCHSPNIILAAGKTRQGWESTITKMVRLGATGTDDDFSDIADYLTDKFPPTSVHKIFVNMATDKEISEVLGISLDDAKAIVAYRDKQKGFNSIEDMKLVPNVDTAKIEAKKDRLVFGAASPTSPAK